MVSLKKLLAVTAVGALMATPAFAQTTGGTGGGVAGVSPPPGVVVPGVPIPGAGAAPVLPAPAPPPVPPVV